MEVKKQRKSRLIAARLPADVVARLMACSVFFAATVAVGQDPSHPLRPPDRSNPRAALTTFLAGGDAVGSFLAHDYLPSPSREKYRHLVALSAHVVQGLDLRRIPPAARGKKGSAAAMALYETLSRIQLPPLEEIPDTDQWGARGGTNSVYWTIPNTEIVLVCEPGGPHGQEFLFSAETVARANDFYKRVRGLAYARPVPQEHMLEITMRGGGWLVPYAWVQALPAWLQRPLAGQAGWKWIGLALILGFFWLLLRLTFRLSRWGNSAHPLMRAWAQVSLPTFLLLAAQALAYVAIVQFNLRGSIGGAIELAETAVMYLAGAWIAWRVAPVVAEAIIASPKIPTESLDAHLIRICTRLLGLAAGVSLLAMGADRLGAHTYGIIAGLGVGGLAIALAAQPTIENLIGGMSLFADKPMQVGDYCKFGTDEGTVEGIGIRSTRIRGLDRVLMSIPNAELSKMPIVNLTARDKMLIESVIGVRYETTSEQLRHLLVKIREMLFGHPRIHPDLARVRFIGFGASSLDIEVFAYATTRDKAEFLSIREDVWLRVMDLVEQSGTAIAFPSQTLYLGRDGGLDAARTQAAEAEVHRWRADGHLPFPNFSPEQIRGLRGSLAYPPPGAVETVDVAPGVNVEPSDVGEIPS